MATCTASWPGGACDRPPVAKGLCTGHYYQQRRGQDFALLKGPHGQIGEEALEMITLRAPRADIDTLKAAARERGVDAAEVYREALEREAKRLRRRTSD